MTTTFSREVAAEGGTTNSSILQWLANPRSYPEATQHVERIETHISWVFLTDRFAYKLKRPVKFDFVDFSTEDQRRRACEQEVQLNRRLARDVYLGVVPITLQQTRLSFGGPGKPIEWVVKMRRLPAERALDQLVASKRLVPADVDELSVLLAEFYQRLPPLSISAERYRQQIESHLLGNYQALANVGEAAGAGTWPLSSEAECVKRVHSAQLRLLRLAPELLDRRVCDGRVVEGHGDLRPEHIYFTTCPTIIDCIEFNQELRQLDVLDELAFLAEECEHLGAGWIGDCVLDEYRAASGDQFSDSLLEFYKSYRACVRAKVSVLRASQVLEADQQSRWSEARQYLQLADLHAARLGPPALIVVYGLPGTGKSTLGQRLAEQLQIDRLATDSIRRELFQSVSPTDYNSGVYRPQLRRRVYDEMFQRAERSLRDGLSVVIDGTFPTAELRRQAADAAGRHAAVPLLVHCHCPPETALERIVSRGRDSLSDASSETYQRQRSEYEPDPPDLTVCDVHTDDGLAEITERVFRQLRQALGL